MGTTFRILVWNCRRASAESPAWDYLLDLAPDVALLQEVGGLPDRVRSVFSHRAHRPAARSGRPQRFSTVILVRGEIGNPIPLRGPSDWVETELARFSGNLVAWELLPDNGPRLKAVCVYSPAWPVDRSRLTGIDVTGVRLIQNPDVWVADLLWACLRHQPPRNDDPWVIAGDFNLSETFDLWPGGPRGNREYLNRMAEVGLVECLRQAKGTLTPTFQNTGSRAIKHQIDHLFVTGALADRLVVCVTGSAERVFGLGLSDHLPIVADFTVKSVFRSPGT